MRFLLLDHYDSFSWNVFHLMREAGMEEVTVTRPHEMSLSQALQFDHFVLSPGPGRPDHYPWTISLIQSIGEHQGLFGICLGMQAMYLASGGSLKMMSEVSHGVRTSLTLTEKHHPLFHSIEEHPIKVGKYHSWIPENTYLPKPLKCLAKDENGNIMAIEHRGKPQWGVQFHPESIMSQGGKNMMQAFHSLCVDVYHT